MRRLESSPEDDRRHVCVYELQDGRRITLDRSAVLLYGAEKLMRQAGIDPWAPGEREKNLPVMQRGRRVGWMAATFDPTTSKPTSFFYDRIRPGDFRREGDAWIADPMLGPGDLEAIGEFRSDRESLRDD